MKENMIDFVFHLIRTNCRIIVENSFRIDLVNSVHQGHSASRCSQTEYLSCVIYKWSSTPFTCVMCILIKMFMGQLNIVATL